MKIISSLFRFILRLTAATLVVSGIIYYFIGTQSGLQMMWGAAEKYIPDYVTVGSVDGNLISGLTVRDFAYHDDGVNVSIHSFSLRWDALKIWRRQFVIHDADIDGVSVNIQQKTSSQPSTIQSADVLWWLRKINIERAAVHHAQLNFGDAHIELDGSLDDNWHAAWSVNIPNLNQFTADISGKLITNGTIAGSRLQPKINADINLEKFKTAYFSINSLNGYIHSEYRDTLNNLGKLRVQGLIIEDFRVPDFTLGTMGKVVDGSYQLQAQAVLSPVNVVKAKFVLPQFTSAMTLDQPFTASATANVKDFAQFNTLFVDVPQVRDFAGVVTGMFTGSGTLLHPVFDGGLEAQHGSVFVPAANMRLTDIHLKTHYHTGQKVNLNGTFTAGKGRASVDGTYGIEESSLPLLLNIQGTDVSIINTKEYKVKISPDMTLDYRNNDLILGGKIFVPDAEIHPVDFRSTATLPSDVVIVNRHTAVTSVPTNVSLRVQVILGQRVKLQYRELNTKLSGSINISGAEGKPMSASGEFRIEDGIYRAYGRNLNIQQGRLIYAGNLLTNPGISLRATQTVKTVGFSNTSKFESKPVYAGSSSVLVGVAVSGVIDKPRLTLFSDEPGLSQGNILSYLLFGYPQAQITDAASAALMSVASDMYGEQKKNPVSSLQNKLGLNELGVGSVEYFDMRPNADNKLQNSTQKDTTVNVGRNFGNNLSLHYSYGLFKQIQVFSLRYQIDRHFAVQTETSTLENGGDLMYQMESAH